MPRLYLVENQKTGEKRLVNANTAAQALTYITKGSYSAKPASSDEVAECYENGIKREDATADPEPKAEPEEVAKPEAALAEEKAETAAEEAEEAEQVA